MSGRLSPPVAVGTLLGATLVGLLVLPLLALALSSSPADLRAGVAHPGHAPGRD